MCDDQIWPLKIMPTKAAILSNDQLETFLRDGVLVVNDILTPEQLSEARHGLETSLRQHGVDTNDLLGTGIHLAKLSSTNGSGGVLDLVYEEWKMNVALNEKLFQATTELWNVAFCHNNENQNNELACDEQRVRWHPFRN